MADNNVSTPSMISGFDSLLSLVGDEFVEIVKRLPDGSYKNYRVVASKLRTGKSVYDIAVEQGFVGDEVAFLESLHGESAYQIAVRTGLFEGTEEEWAESLGALYSRNPENAGKVLTANAEGVGEFLALTPAAVGMDKVDNTPDAEKIVSDPQKQEFARYLLRSRVNTEVMKVLLGLPVFKYNDDMTDLVITTLPVPATSVELSAGTDNAKFATAASLKALLTEIGFTKNPDGSWKLKPSVVVA